MKQLLTIALVVLAMIPFITSYGQTASEFLDRGKHELDLKHIDAAIYDFNNAIKLGNVSNYLVLL